MPAFSPSLSTTASWSAMSSPSSENIVDFDKKAKLDESISATFISNIAPYTTEAGATESAVSDGSSWPNNINLLPRMWFILFFSSMENHVKFCFTFRVELKLFAGSWVHHVNIYAGIEKMQLKEVIQTDEAALSEGLPLYKSEHPFYLDWAAYSFGMTIYGVQDTT